VAISVFVFSACEKDDRLDPNRPGLAPAPTISGPTVNTVPQHGITLTASVEVPNTEVTSWIWRRSNDGGGSWTTISGATGPTLEVRSRDSAFPYGGIFRAAAVTPQGTGDFSSRHEVNLIAPELPHKPTIRPTTYDTIIDGVVMNECPTPAVVLTARSPFATSYRWYFNGDVIPGATRQTYRIQVEYDSLGVAISGTGTGTYTVVAINHLGQSAASEPIEVEWMRCTPFDITDEWSFSGGEITSGANAGPIKWTDTIVQDTAAAAGDSTFRMRNFLDDEWEIIIYRDADGDFYIPSAMFVLYPNLGGAGVHGQQTVSTLILEGPNAGASLMFLNQRIYLDVSRDQTMFKLPALPPHATHGPLNPNTRLGYRAVNPANEHLGWFTGMNVQGGSWSRGGSSSAAPASMNLIDWIPACPQKNAEVFRNAVLVPASQATVSNTKR
jgi:hypothetical protein